DVPLLAALERIRGEGRHRPLERATTSVRSPQFGERVLLGVGHHLRMVGAPMVVGANGRWQGDREGRQSDGAHESRCAAKLRLRAPNGADSLGSTTTSTT